ncbi:hypothetical protein HK104_002107 [Borealophlyctis nickersoniae]|nr:hypothetical protein HK104_002107 [Borealophlyctis nickersoniae]
MLILPLLLSLATPILALKNNSTPSCPPTNFTSLHDFNLTAYISGPWFVQAQIPVEYQPRDNLFCVRANYTLQKNGTVSVYNYANRKKVNGKVQDAHLTAYVDEKVPSQLMVGPINGPKSAFGRYWVVAAGPGPDRYTYAIVTGGSPNQVSKKRCLPSAGPKNDLGGMWILTRKQVVKPERLAKLMKVAKKLGLDITELVMVQQNGCKYDELDE